MRTTLRSAAALCWFGLVAACGATGLSVGLPDAPQDAGTGGGRPVREAGPADDAGAGAKSDAGADARSGEGADGDGEGADGDAAATPDAGADAPAADEDGPDAALASDGPVESAGPRNPWYCHDGVQDDDETDVDCGGSCPACWFGQHCATNEDCSATAPACNTRLGGCACDAITMTCVADGCVDHKKDGAETGVDCGGGKCPQCATGEGCSVDYDCSTQACDAVSSTCVADPCSDHRQDGWETAVDCGGGLCPGCALGVACGDSWDCASGFCDGVTRTCVSDGCTDHALDGQETDTDCGGPVCAARCPENDFCDTDSDCEPGLTCGGSPRECG